MRLCLGAGDGQQVPPHTDQEQQVDAPQQTGAVAAPGGPGEQARTGFQQSRQDDRMRRKPNDGSNQRIAFLHAAIQEAKGRGKVALLKNHED